MASFTDAPIQFNPYIQSQPIEAMSRIGMVREQQFQQGLATVQSWIDNTLGAPIAKGETKEYVKQKVSALGESLRGSISGDLSKQRIINNVGGMFSQITNDPIVRNGIESTARIQSGMAALEASKKDGKWSQQNQDFFNESVSRWLSDGDIETAFDDSYTPWVDYQKKFMDAYKEVNKGENIDADAFRIDANGNLSINPVLREGVTPDKIKSVWNLVSSSPDVQKQLQIDGWSRFRGLDDQAIVNNLAESTNASLRDIQATINNLQTELATSPGVDTAKISSQVEQLQRQAQEKKRSADATMLAIDSDPERAKTLMQEQDILSNLIGAYSYETMKKSPLWETSMEQQRFDREAQHWEAEYQLKLQTERRLAAKDKKETDAQATGQVVLDGPVSVAQAGGSARALQTVEDSRTAYVQAQRALIASVAGVGVSPYVLNQATGQYDYNPNLTKGQADEMAYNIYAKVKDNYMNGKITDPAIAAKAETTQNAYDDLQAANKVITDVNNELSGNVNEALSVLPQVRGQVTLSGRTYPVNTADLADVYISANGLPGADAATTRLNQKYGNSRDFIMKTAGLEGGFSKEYQQIASIMRSNKNIPEVLRTREDAFARRQMTAQNRVVTYPIDTKSNDINIRNFTAAARQVQALNEGATKGPASDMLELLAKTDKESKNNFFQSSFDVNTGRGTLIVGRGTETPIKLDVPASTYFSIFPEQQLNRTFSRKFGAKLSAGQGNTAWDSPINPRATAYVAQQPTDSPYAVQYHLKKTGTGANGDLYDMFWWITPRGGDTPIVEGKMNGTVPEFPIDATEADIVRWSEQLKNKDFISTIVQEQLKRQNR